MTNKTKKRILTLALVIALLATVMIGSSLAWFSAEASAENVFTVGSVEIIQNEEQYERENGERTENKEPFDQNKTLIPVVNEEDPYNDDNYQDKIVSVTNTGRNGAYVRTHIAVPSDLVGYLCLDVEKNTPWSFAYSTAGVVEKDGVAYTVYTYEYSQELAPDATTETLLNGVYLYADVDLKQAQDGTWQFCKWNAETGSYDFSGFVVEKVDDGVEETEELQKVYVLVASQAVQADGFDGPTTALDSAFGVQGIPEFK